MARKKRWKQTSYADGVQEITLSSWKYFSDFINQKLLDYRTYIFRGQANDRWTLEPSLDRILKQLPKWEASALRSRHMENFKRAARGRRGPTPRVQENDNDWWALGRHHGLVTPLLDWTESPFVALYFAFVDEKNESSDHRAVFGLSESHIQAKTRELTLKYESDKLYAELEVEKGELSNERGQTIRPLGHLGRRVGPPPPAIVDIIRPLSDENPRLVSQRGLFVRSPDGIPVEAWVREHFKGETMNIYLMKIRIPDEEREKCLQFLNRMNINHLSLFPDLYGASVYCNTDLVIKNY